MIHKEKQAKNNRQMVAAFSLTQTKISQLFLYKRSSAIRAILEENKIKTVKIYKKHRPVSIYCWILRELEKKKNPKSGHFSMPTPF